MSEAIDSTIEYALECLATVAKQVDDMRIPDRTWTYMLSRMDTWTRSSRSCRTACHSMRLG